MDGSRELIEVVAAVIADDGKYLACRRREGKTAGGLWEFPGGKVEPGESSAAALVREIREELEVEISVGPLLVESENIDAGIRLLCFRATINGATPTQSSDHDRLEWVEVVELSQLSWAPADWPAVAQLQHESGLDHLKARPIPIRESDSEPDHEFD